VSTAPIYGNPTDAKAVPNLSRVLLPGGHSLALEVLQGHDTPLREAMTFWNNQNAADGGERLTFDPRIIERQPR
jgi:ubiquinone/menaquinone biosynthesis C-methylase UbiE